VSLNSSTKRTIRCRPAARASTCLCRLRNRREVARALMPQGVLAFPEPRCSRQCASKSAPFRSAQLRLLANGSPIVTQRFRASSYSPVFSISLTISQHSSAWRFTLRLGLSSSRSSEARKVISRFSTECKERERIGVLFTAQPIAIALQLIAVALMVLARVTFGRRSFHAAANPTAGGLVTTGPYRIIRHPISAACLFGWGPIVVQWSW
jgi:hypothetical protein